MEDFYHTDLIPGGLTFDSGENGQPRPLTPRTYNFFSQMAGENAQSRIYLGIHWEFDAVEGIRCGDHIADYVYSHSLAPLRGPRLSVMPNLDPRAQVGLSVLLENVAADGGLRLGRFGDRFEHPGPDDPHSVSMPGAPLNSSADDNSPRPSPVGADSPASIVVGNWGAQISSETTFWADGERPSLDAAVSDLLAELLKPGDFR
jgi:hypothetical protein